MLVRRFMSVRSSVLASGLVLLAFVLAPVAAADKASPDSQPDAVWLSKHGVTPDANGLQQYLQRLSSDNAGSGMVDELIRKLGSDHYKEREEATERLLALPSLPETALKKAAESTDMEVRTRAEHILQQGSFKLNEATLLAALRTLQRRQFKGLAPAVINVATVFPSPRVQSAALGALEATAAAADANLLRQCIKGDNPSLAVLGVGGLAAALGATGAGEIRPLLDSPREPLRIAAAKALADLGDHASLPVLGKGLLSEDVTVRVECINVLRGLTGQKLTYVAYDPPETRKTAAEAWMKWLDTDGKTAKLTFPVPLTPPEIGRTLLCQPGKGFVVEYDADGNEAFKVAVNGAWACQGLPNGHRLIGSFGTDTVIEYDEAGKEVWKKDKLPHGPMSVQRLENGNTLLACADSQLVLEIKPDGSTAWKVELAGRPADARRLENGNTLVCLHQANRVVEIDSAGIEVWRLENVNDAQAAQRLENGNTFVVMTTPGVLREYTPSGEQVWSYEGLQVVVDAHKLPNGNVLAIEQGGNMLEISPDGKIVSKKEVGTMLSRVSRY